MTRLRIGTRGSSLALWQANHIANSLAKLHGVETELVRIRTSGDRLQSASVAQVNEAIGAEGGKGIFIKEIEDALLSGAVDLAVHSMKDVPTEIPAGLAFAAVTRREDPRDCLISREGWTLEKLPDGARVGTSSLRRQAQLRHHRPDLDVVDLRGNVDTRIRKLERGEFDAIVLAMAGVTRLGASAKVTQIFDEDLMLPAVGQGALGIETRADDAQTSRFVAALDDEETSRLHHRRARAPARAAGRLPGAAGRLGTHAQGRVASRSCWSFPRPAPNPCVSMKLARLPKPRPSAFASRKF